MTVIDFAHFLDQLATDAGKAIMPFFRTQISVQDKNHGGSFDPVTEADKAAEAIMRSHIRRNFPQHGIIGEEFGSENEAAEYVWVLDPIDGTKSFLCGLPTWGILIGLMRNGVSVQGMMHQPFTQETFYGDGQSTVHRSVLGERRLRVRPCEELAHATISTTHPALMQPEERELFHKIETETRLSRYGGDCYAYCMLASGHMDLILESGLNSYDVAALIPIVQGAGGVITTWEGGDPAQGGQIIAAGDRRLHEYVLNLLHQA